MHWACDYIGIPWVFGGRNTITGFDCYGIFKHIQEKHYGINMSESELISYTNKNVVKDFKTNSEFLCWQEVDVPKDGDAVLLKIARFPIHIGIYIKTDTSEGVLHSIEDHGTIFSTASNLKHNNWKIASYHRHKSKL